MLKSPSLPKTIATYVVQLNSPKHQLCRSHSSTAGYRTVFWGVGRVLRRHGARQSTLGCGFGLSGEFGSVSDWIQPRHCFFRRTLTSMHAMCRPRWRLSLGFVGAMRAMRRWCPSAATGEPLAASFRCGIRGWWSCPHPPLLQDPSRNPSPGVTCWSFPPCCSGEIAIL